MRDWLNKCSRHVKDDIDESKLESRRPGSASAVRGSSVAAVARRHLALASFLLKFPALLSAAKEPIKSFLAPPVDAAAEAAEAAR
eukprot:COSAG05_NODE_23855_length_255_cov_0.666667_1_plen_84_part_11